MKKFIFITILFSFLGLVNFANAATLSLSPSSGSYSLGQIFTVKILLNTIGKKIDGVDIFSLNYDPAYLEVQDENSGTSGIQILPGSLMPMTLANSVDISTGKIIFSQITAGGTTFSNNTGQTLTTIRFKVLKESDTSVYFDFIENGTTETNIASGGLDILSTVTNGNYGPTATPLEPSKPSPAPSPTPTPISGTETFPSDTTQEESSSALLVIIAVIIAIVAILIFYFIRKKNNNIIQK